MMTANSAVHYWAARALFRLRKFAAAGEHDRLANAEVLATFGPTSPRSRSKPLGRPIGTYDGTCVPACQRQRTNWLHGLPAMSDLCIESAFHRSSSQKRPKMAESSLFSAGGHLPLTWAVPGNPRTGPGGPAGPPYGRTEHGRSRGARGRSSRRGKGVKTWTVGEPRRAIPLDLLRRALRAVNLSVFWEVQMAFFICTYLFGFLSLRASMPQNPRRLRPGPKCYGAGCGYEDLAWQSLLGASFEGDQTRPHKYYDETYEYFREIGIKAI